MPAKPHIKRLAHLCFKTDQVDKMVPFYRDLLGLPVEFTMTNKDGMVFGYYFACSETTFIEIFDQRGAVRQWGGEVMQLKTAAAGTTYQHFCLEIKGLEAERADLLAKGVAVGEISVGMDGSKQCWIKDPDGNDIELMEYTPASLQLKKG